MADLATAAAELNASIETLTANFTKLEELITLARQAAVLAAAARGRAAGRSTL
jgi:hypothetical protein